MPPLPTYLRFRTRLAHQALLQLIASVISSLEIVLVIFAPVLLGLIAFIALPGLYAATLAWPRAIALVLLQSLLCTLPVWLLRKRVLPLDVLAWLRPLPVPPRAQLRANIAVAGILVGPLALAYTLSIAVWLFQWPLWLRPVAGAGIALTIVSLLLTWGGAVAILHARWQPEMAPAEHAASKPAAPRAWLPGRTRPRALLLWHKLFWLPFWRADNVVGLQQSCLLLAAAVSAALWLWPVFPGGLAGAATSVVLILLADRGDKAVRAQITALRPSMAAWPVPSRNVESTARVFSLLPGLLIWCVCLILMVCHASALSHRAAALYLTVAALAQLTLVGLPETGARARVGLVVIFMLVLTAIGSELWN
jgi:hypothetical protein